MKYVRGPKSQFEISSGQPNVIDRSQQIRRDDDKVKDYTNSLYDIDYAIQYYIKNVIKPSVVENGKIIPVPVMYGSPEQWTSVRKMAFIRDNKGKMLVPLIAYTQTGGSKNTEMPIDKLDANNPHILYTYGQRWTKKNQYDNFNVLTGKSPAYELYRIIVPDYLILTYDVVIWTTYMEQMNKIIESIVYSEGAYWGEEERGKFKTTISDYSKSVEVSQGNDRFCKTNISLTVYGYIIPDTINKQLSMKNAPQKIFSNSKITFSINPDVPDSEFSITSTQDNKTSINTNNIIPQNLTSDTFNKQLSTYTEFARNNYQLIASEVNTSGPYTIIMFPSASLAKTPQNMNPLTVEDFMLFVNGQNIDRQYYQVPIELNGSVYIYINNTQLNFNITSDDTIVIYGKFASAQNASVIQNDSKLKTKQILFKDLTLEGQTTITGSLTIIGETTSSGSITIPTGGYTGSIDLGTF